MPQGCVSVPLPVQFAPPPCAAVLLRRRACTPEPQGTLQLPQELQVDQLQSAGQSCTLQGCVSLVLVQGRPPLAAAVVMVLALLCVPPPQVAEQLPKFDQLLKTQSIGHD